MGKRSTGRFKRRAHDLYPTPYKAVAPLVRYLQAEGVVRFSEPCSGEGDLVAHLESFGFTCVHDGDLRRGQNALHLDVRQLGEVDAIITNPPWTRQLLHPLIEHLRILAPTWLLLDADWMQNQHAAPHLAYCSTVLPIGRVKWFPNSAHVSIDNCCWYRFQREATGGPIFLGRQLEAA
jgi:hypothetical protein